MFESLRKGLRWALRRRFRPKGWRAAGLLAGAALVGTAQATLQSGRSGGREDGPIELVEVLVEPQPVTPGTPHKYTVQLSEGVDYSFLVHHSHSDRRRATGAVCPYDFRTDLGRGLLINNKLVCPEHGCEFNIDTGEVENGPAVNGIPVFKVEKTGSEEEVRLSVQLPKQPPIAVLPQMIFRNPQDFRKVMVVGCGGGALGAAETLRKIGYTGELMVFCDERQGFVQRRHLTRCSRLAGNEQMIFYRSPAVLRKASIEVSAGDAVDKVTLLDDYGYLNVAGKGKYYFDALVMATGERHSGPNQERLDASNLVSLTDFDSFRRAEKLLDRSKVVAVNGLSLESLELVSTLLRERPGLAIHVFSNSRKSELEQALGKPVFESVLGELRKRGVQVNADARHVKLKTHPSFGYVTEVVYGPSPAETRSVVPDLVYDFPVSVRANTALLDSEKYRDVVYKNDEGQIEVDDNQRTPKRFVFAAGGASATSDFCSHRNLKRPSFADAYHQGEVAAYNIQALKVPNTRPAFGFHSVLGRTLQTLGTQPEHCEQFTEGSPEALDFITYFLENNKIVAVNATERYQRETMLLKEAMRAGLLIDVNAVKRDRTAFYARLQEELLGDPRRRCFRDLVFKKRHNVQLSDVFWRDRSTTEGVRSDSFVNFKPGGQ